MKDIAEKVGVSKATVSMVINKKDSNISEETKKKIYNAIEEMGYIPNNVSRGLNTKIWKYRNNCSRYIKSIFLRVIKGCRRFCK